MIRRVMILVLVALLLWPARTMAHEGHPVSHTEQVVVGPYLVTLEFSEWPIRAQRSLDIIFWVEGGIEAKQGTVRLVHPDYTFSDVANSFVRHPRYRTAWGLDQTTLPLPGEWIIELEIDGPAGIGQGRSTPIVVLAPPGPPPLFSWTLGFLPLFALIGFAVRQWTQMRRLAVSDATSWN